MSRPEIAGLVEILVEFLSLVRMGPTGVVSALEASAGGLTAKQRASAFEEVGHPQDTHRKLMLLRSLMEAAGGRRILGALDPVKAFSCFSSQACSQLMER